MFLRILELAATLIVLTVTVKEIILPLIFDKPLFPLLRKTAADVREERKETHL